MTRVKVKVAKSFLYNGEFVLPGEEIEMWDERAANHMRAGDVERDEAIIKTVKERREAKANAALQDAQMEW